MRVSLPVIAAPMLTTLVDHIPTQGDWCFEYKWDGYRALARWDGQRLQLLSRRDREILPEFPELEGIGTVLGAPTILDGELVALDAQGQPSFHALQLRGTRRPPIVYMLFDCLHRAGRTLMPLPYRERRAVLEGLGLAGRHWQVPSYRDGQGAAVLEAARAHHLEGVVAKRGDSPYLPGPSRSGYWLKIKLLRREEFVIGGFLPGSAGFTGVMGALLLGFYDRPGHLRYAGKVGTGFRYEERAQLQAQLQRLARPTSPFATPVPRFPVPTTFCQPRLIAEVTFTELTPDGLLRHPAFIALREDKRPSEVGDPRPRPGPP